MYVNDGVCDYENCCDGSEEWKGVGGVKCKDRCSEIGKEWRRADEERQKRFRDALKKKSELVKEAKAKKEGVAKAIGETEKEIQSLEVRERELKKIYEDIERRERGRVVSGGEGKGSKVTILAGLAKARVEELRSTLVGVVAKRNGLQEKVKELEGILAKFKEERNPNFNDEGVKRAVQAWEDYAANRMATADESAADRDLEDVVKPDSETEGINWEEWETEGEESDVDASMLSPSLSYLPSCHNLFTNTMNSLRIRRIPPRPRPRLGPPETHRHPHHARGKRHPRRQRQLRPRIQSRLHGARGLPIRFRFPQLGANLPGRAPTRSRHRLRPR